MKDFCPKGHPYSGENLRIQQSPYSDVQWRACRICAKANSLSYQARQRRAKIRQTQESRRISTER